MSATPEWLVKMREADAAWVASPVRANGTPRCQATDRFVTTQAIIQCGLPDGHPGEWHVYVVSGEPWLGRKR